MHPCPESHCKSIGYCCQKVLCFVELPGIDCPFIELLLRLVGLLFFLFRRSVVFILFHKANEHSGLTFLFSHSLGSLFPSCS
jgi:hypothetical protein